MQSKANLSIIRLSVVVLIWLSTGVVHAQTKKLACVGDSITALPSSWCGVLDKKIPEWDVQNFGVSGTNASKGVGQPYWNSAKYKPSHDFLPNVVVIMLGTNDGTPRVWGSGKSHFAMDYEELIDTYEMLSSKPRVYVIIPIPAGTGPFGHDPDIIADEIGPAVKMVAMKRNVTTIDGFGVFGGKDFDESLYGAMDQIHPNAKGQELLGNAVYEVLDETGGLTGMPVAPAAGDGGVASAADAGAVTGADAGAGGAAAADAGAVRARPDGGADPGSANGAPSDAGRSNGGTRPLADGSANGARDSGVPAKDPPSDDEDEDDETSESDAPSDSEAGSRDDDGGCQATGRSGTGATVMLLVLLGLALRSRKFARLMRER